MQLTGRNGLAKVSASGPMPGKINYFVGNDPKQWHTDVEHFAQVSYQDVYPGVNLTFHGVQRQTEFDFVVAPQANTAPIAFHFTGAQSIKTDDSGNLVIASAAGNILLHQPVAYQERNGARQPVEARFTLKADDQVGFELGSYDRSRELVIDPSVSYVFSTYLGGSGTDAGYGIAFDGNGNAYVTGQTASTNFPTSAGALQTTLNSNSGNAFVTEIAASGSSFVYSTYIGGSGSSGDSGNAIAVDGLGDAFVAGGTTSHDFPTTGGAFQGTLAGAGNAFVLELGSGGRIIYSTFLGGTGSDSALGIALASDGSGDVFVVGKATSQDFPTLNPIQAYLPGSASSGFVTKLNSSATGLVYSTYLGGSVGGDLAEGTGVDSSDNVYVTGQTFNPAFPVTTGAFQITCGSCVGGNSNAFVTAINTAGSNYAYSTFLGGSGTDAGSAIAVDAAGDAYVTGSTTSSNFPHTTGAFQTTYGGSTDAFVTKLNPAGTSATYSTYLGGSGLDSGAGIAVDGSGNAYVTGQTGSSGGSPFPTINATQSTYGGGASDAFVTEINPAGAGLIFSTYLGGSNEDDSGSLGGIAVDSAGANIYVTGNTDSTNFPTQSPFPYSGGNAFGGGVTDAFVVKYTTGAAAPTFSLSAAPTSLGTISPGGQATSTVTVTGTGGFTGTVTLSCSASPAISEAPTCSGTATPGIPGTLTVNTTGPTVMLRHPSNGPSSGMLYALLLPVAGISLAGIGFSGPGRRKKLFGILLIGMIMATLLLMPACAGGSGGGGGGGGGRGTPANTYTITVTGTASGALQTGTQPSLTLVVN